MNLSLAIYLSRPDAQWSLRGDTLDGLTWIGPGEPPTQDELQAAWDVTTSYESARSNLAAYWSSQPAWIRGPFDASYQSAVSLLDRHDIDAAVAIITYAPIPAAYTQDQVADYETVRATLLAGLESLRD